MGKFEEEIVNTRIEMSSKEVIGETEGLQRHLPGSDDELCNTIESKQPLSLELECTSREGLFHTLSSFKNEEFSNHLTSVADALSRHVGQKITLKALLNVQDVMEAIEEESDKTMCDVFRKHDLIDTLPQSLHRQSAEVLAKSVRPDLDKSFITLDNMASNRRIPDRTRLTSERYTGMSEKSDRPNVDNSSSDSITDNTHTGDRARLSSNMLAKSGRPNVDNSPSDSITDNTHTRDRARLSSKMPINNVRTNAGNSSQNVDKPRQPRGRNQRESSPEYSEKNCVTIIASYSLLKEELQKSEVNYLGKALCSDWEAAVQAAETRRDHVEILLKEVLKSSEHTQASFIGLLKNTFGRIKLKNVTDTHVREYRSLRAQHYPISESQPIHLQQPKCSTFSKNDRETLTDFLRNGNYIEKIIDEFLSKFIFTLDQHSKISSCEKGNNSKVTAMINLMEPFNEQTYETFAEILISLNLDNVLSNLERHKESKEQMEKPKRKRSSYTEIESETEQPSRKKLCLSKELEKKVVEVGNMPTSSIKTSFKALDFEIKCVRKKSIVIDFCATGPHAWDNLKEFCKSKKIGEVVTDIFDDKDLYDTLEDGMFNVNIKIYKGLDSTKGMMVLKNYEDNPAKGKHPRRKQVIPEDSVFALLTEELDVNEELLNYLRREHVVTANIVADVSKLAGRKEKTKHVLQEVLKNDIGYDKLRIYIEHTEVKLYKRLLVEEKDVKLNSSFKKLPSISREYNSKETERTEMFFTCVAVLQIKKQDGKVRVSCPYVSQCVNYFDEDSDTGFIKGKRRYKTSEEDKKGEASPAIRRSKRIREKTNAL